MPKTDMEQGLDQEGKDVLSELANEGFDIAGREPEEPVEEAPETPGEQPSDPAPEGEDPKDPENPPADDPDKGEPADDKVEDPDPSKGKPDRKPQFVPLAKYLTAETQLKEALAKLAEKGDGGAPTQQQISAAQDTVQKDTIEKLVELGYDEDQAKTMAEVIKAVVPGQQLPPELQTKMAQLDILLEKTSAEAEVTQFNNDFTSSVLNEFPHLDKFKQQIHDKAYTEEYKNVPLRTIAIEFMHDEGISVKPGPVKTVERSGGGSQAGVEEINFDELTDEQFSNLTPEQMDQFHVFQDKKEKKARGALN